jgi:hypothetical protein
VSHVEREKGKKKKVVLSVNPKRLNKGITRDNVMQGMVWRIWGASSPGAVARCCCACAATTHSKASAKNIVDPLFWESVYTHMIRLGYGWPQLPAGEAC